MSDSETSSDQEDHRSEESTSAEESGSDSEGSGSEEDEPARIMRMVQEFDSLPPYAQKIVSEHILDRMGKTVKKEKKNKPNKKKRKNAKNSDPAKPKHPTNAYLYFTVTERKKLQEEMPNSTRLDRVRLMSERWAKMTDVDKQPYLEKAAADKRRYKHEMSDYERKHGRLPGRAGKRKGRAVSVDAPPKRPPNAYLRFSVEKRAEMREKGEVSGKEDGVTVAKRVGDMWRSLSDEEKRPYFAVADRELDHWKQVMERWKVEHPQWQANERLKRRKAKKQREAASESESDSDDEDDDDDDEVESTNNSVSHAMYPPTLAPMPNMYHPHYAQIMQHQQYMQQQHNAAQAAAAVQQHQQQQQQQQQQQVQYVQAPGTMPPPPQ